MEKTEIGPPYQFMASWPKKFQLWGGQNTFGAQNNFGVPRFRIFDKKNFNSNSQAPCPKNSTLRVSKYFLAPYQNMSEEPHFRIFDPWKYHKMIFIIQNITKFECWNIANFVTFLMKKKYFDPLKVVLFGPGACESKLRTNFGFWLLLRVKNPKMGYLQNILGPKNNITPSKLKFLEPWGPELILRSDFCFFHFLKNFIISFFFENIWSNFLKIFFAHLMRNFFLIIKWFHFLSFAQNWPICEGLKFSLLKMDNFPFSEVSAPGTP